MRRRGGQGHRALARSSLLRDWFPCAGAVLSLAQTHRGRPQTTSMVWLSKRDREGVQGEDTSWKGVNLKEKKMMTLT